MNAKTWLRIFLRSLLGREGFSLLVVSYLILLICAYIVTILTLLTSMLLQ